MSRKAGEVESDTRPIVYTRLSCGLHFADPDRKDRTCTKCRHFEKLDSNPKYKAGLQYEGTPWICVLEQP